MIGPNEQAKAVDGELLHWRQGDVSLDSGLEFMHLADLSRPHSPISIAAAAGRGEEAQAEGVVPVIEEVEGIVMLTQTCDIVRSCLVRPFVEIALLAKHNDEIVEQARRLKRPSFAYVPVVAGDGLVADLDRIMTVEKAVVANWTRTPGWTEDWESRDFAYAIARKRSRFAFPDDFVRMADDFRRRLTDKHGRRSPEGKFLRSLREIRVRARPSWSADYVKLKVWFIRDRDPDDGTSDWSDQVDRYIKRFDQSGRFRVEAAVVRRLDQITARDYVESDMLDFDSLSLDQIGETPA